MYRNQCFIDSIITSTDAAVNTIFQLVNRKQKSEQMKQQQLSIYKSVSEEDELTGGGRGKTSL
jgi:hypothetical protein